MTSLREMIALSYQSFFQLAGTLIASLLIALLVSNRFLVSSGSDTQAVRWLAEFRRIVALVGVIAAVAGESQVLKALLNGSPESSVTPVSVGLGVLFAALLAGVLSEALEVTAVAKFAGVFRRVVVCLVISAVATVAGSAWAFYVRHK